MSTLDLILFVVAVVGVIAMGIRMGRRQATAAGDEASDYFLAGRGLSWWLIGFSLIAANISTEQFVGMSGQAADWLGLAIASYEWLSAIALVVVAFVFLPRLLRCGIYTIPEFLEYRFSRLSRIVMAMLSMVVIVGVPSASVIYSGAKVISVFFHGVTVAGIDLGSVQAGCWIIGLAAAAYVLVGGLKACAWTDLVWGSALIVGGAMVMWLAFSALAEMPASELVATKVTGSPATVEQLEKAGPLQRFLVLNQGPVAEGPNLSGGKLHLVRPKSDSDLPWTALVFGLWIPCFFYWGLNQYVVQRTLGSKSLAEGQKGIVLAAGLKLLIPFVVVVPGMLCFNLYRNDLRGQADLRNAPVLELLQAGKPTAVIPFTAEYAALQAATARQVVAHNASLTGANPILAPSLTAEELVAANATMLERAAARGMTTSQRLVGHDYDSAFGILLRHLLKPGITWFVLAAMFGAVVSSLAAMLNSASTIATMDLYAAVRKGASQRELVGAGRVFVGLFVLIAILAAVVLADGLQSVFRYIQEFQGFISPGVLAVFLFGFLVPRAPRFIGWLGILLNAMLYAAFTWWLGPLICKAGWWWAPQMSFLDRMGVCFLLVSAACAAATLLYPLAEPVRMPVTARIPLTNSRPALYCGFGVIGLTLALYLWLW
jgi:SSS family solute:Na+ symporter